MKHAIQTVILVSGALSLTIGAVAKVAADANEEGKVALICYKWDGFPDERLRVSIRKPAAITETVPAQVEWSPWLWQTSGMSWPEQRGFSAQ